ncbi:UNVERIFIED_CONTAM: hypothetical protein FKN15_021209 [Acipenser sinensis]
MGRKSCKKQQKRRQQQQLPPGDVGPSYVVDEWCPGCGEFGHTVAICPTQYQEEEVEPEPQPQEEDGWEALLRSMGVQKAMNRTDHEACWTSCRRAVVQATQRNFNIHTEHMGCDALDTAQANPPPILYTLTITHSSERTLVELPEELASLYSKGGRGEKEREAG